MEVLTGFRYLKAHGVFQLFLKAADTLLQLYTHYLHSPVHCSTVSTDDMLVHLDDAIVCVSGRSPLLKIGLRSTGMVQVFSSMELGMSLSG